MRLLSLTISSGLTFEPYGSYQPGLKAGALPVCPSFVLFSSLVCLSPTPLRSPRSPPLFQRKRGPELLQIPEVRAGGGDGGTTSTTCGRGDPGRQPRPRASIHGSREGISTSRASPVSSADEPLRQPRWALHFGGSCDGSLGVGPCRIHTSPHKSLQHVCCALASCRSYFACQGSMVPPLFCVGGRGSNRRRSFFCAVRVGGVGGNRAQGWMPIQQPPESSAPLRRGCGRRPPSETGREHYGTCYLC
jgi:hypothetical protein